MFWTVSHRNLLSMSLTQKQEANLYSERRTDICRTLLLMMVQYTVALPKATLRTTMLAPAGDM